MTSHPPKPEIITELWTFPQRIRFAAAVLREVAAYRSRTRHGESGDVNEHSTWTPYDAGTLDVIADQIEADEASRDAAIDELTQQIQRITRDVFLSNKAEKTSRIVAKQLVADGWRKP